MQKALKHDTQLQRPPLTLDAFGRSAFIKEFKRRLEQAAAKTPILLLKGATGGIAEICTNLAATFAHRGLTSQRLAVL